MNDSDHPSEEAAIKHVDAVLKQLTSRWASIKKARIELDFKTVAQALDGVDENVRQLATSWHEHQTVIDNAIQAEREFVLSDAYSPQVEKALTDAEIPIKGKFPNYEFPPFKLTFSHDYGYVKLSMGRRARQTKVFAPVALAAWVAQEYQRVISTKFNAERFCQELLGAYEMLNRLNLKEESVVWGHPVALKEIYKLLTLKNSVKSDYSEALFAYDLARLKEQFDICYNGHRFEMVPSRNQFSGLLLVSSKGQDSRVSSLIIYEQNNEQMETSDIDAN